MDYRWPQELTDLADEAAAWVREATADLFTIDDGWLVGYSDEFTARLGDRGWIGMCWPTSAGGDGRPEVERFVVTEQLLLGGAPMASSFFPDRQIGPVLLAYGTPQQQARFLPEMRAGRSRWCIGMSEPDAGSDVAAIGTTAVRDGDRFIVNGQKIWTSGAATANWCYLICRTDPDSPPHKGMSELIVPMDSPGIEVRPIRDASGDAHFNEVFFDEVAVPVENLVGELNNSFSQTMRANRVSRNVTYAPAYTIMGGTTQILRNIIGERILRLPREPRVPRG